MYSSFAFQYTVLYLTKIMYDAICVANQRSRNRSKFIYSAKATAIKTEYKLTQLVPE
jgi:hypothetical protein